MTAAKLDCENLLRVALPFAQQLLSRYGEFYPFGNAMLPDEQIIDVGTYDGDERPQAADVIDDLSRVFRAEGQAGRYRATALVFDARVKMPSTGAPSDAIAIRLDHRDDYSVIVFFPYHLDGDTPAIGEPFAERGRNEIFPP